jgi:small conductance mechanosensitive channel
MNIDTSSLTKFLAKLTWETLFSSLITLVVCIIAIKIVMRILRRAFSHTQVDDRLQQLLLTGLKALLYIVTVIIVAQSLGVPSTSLVALLSVASLAISLAVQGMLSNVAGGIMLLTSRPIALGDLAEVAGVTGTVDEIGLLYTKLRTADGQMVMLPNSSISTAQITNYTALGQRRITITIGASYDHAAEDVRRALLEVAGSVDNLLSDPAPVVYLNAYLDSSIEYVLYAWVNAPDYAACRFALNEAVQRVFEKHGIEIPYNHLNVHIVSDGTQSA